MNINELKARLDSNEMIVAKDAAGRDCSIWRQGGFYVMVKQGDLNGTHQIADDSSAERVAAHWAGFTGQSFPKAPAHVVKSPAQREQERQEAHQLKLAALLGPRATWVTVAEACKLEAAECKRLAQRAHRGYLRSREAMVLACNSSGRVGNPLDYAIPSRITGKFLREALRDARKDYAGQFTGLSIEGGVDWFDSFPAMLDGWDYEPSVETWSVDVPAHLVQEG